MNMKAVQQEAASSMVNTIGKTLNVTQGLFEGGAEKMTLCMSAAVPGVSGVAACTVKFIGEGKNYVPTPDQILFASLVLANSINFSGGGHLVVEYSTANFITALAQFETLTGRSFEGELDENLKIAITNARNSVSDMAKNDKFGKFLPH